jgi:hypothetical protein
MVSRVMKGLEKDGCIQALSDGRVLLTDKLNAYLS